MEKGQVIGHQVCPECDRSGAEIKVDKAGNPYRWCPDCNAQYFTRGDPRRVKNLASKMTPIAVSAGDATGGAGAIKAPAPAAPPALTTTDAPAQTVKAGRKPFSMADL